MGDFFRRLVFSLLGIATLVSVVLAAQCILPAYREWVERRAVRSDLTRRVDEGAARIAAINRDIDRFKTSPYFVEQLARANHRVADNEIVFIFE